MILCTQSSTSVTWSVSVFIIGTGAGIPPGGSDSFDFTATPSTAASYPYSSTFTSKVQDASGVNFYNGPSFGLLVIDPTTTVTVTPTTSANYVAGSAALTETATVTPAQGGVPIMFDAPGYGSTTVFSFSPATATTDSTGKATTTFQPSNKAGDATDIEADLGTSSIFGTSVGVITTVPGPATTVTFTAPFGAKHYVTAFAPNPTLNMATVPGGSITLSVADRFGNPIDLSTLGTYNGTITAVASGGFFDTGTVHRTSVVCGHGLTCPASGSLLTISLPYFQSGTYGSSGLLTASVTGTSPAFAAAGSSGSIVTSTFDSVVNAPTYKASTIISVAATCGSTGSVPCQRAGKTITLFFNLTNAQAGVPVTLYLDMNTFNATSADYAGTFSNLAQAFTTTTATKGGASAVFTIDTTALAYASFFANFTRPTDSNTHGTTTPGADTASKITTIGGAATTIKVNVYFTNTAGVLSNPVGTKAVGGLTLWVNAIFSDAYGNKATNPGPNVVQVTLSASGGVLSATTIYIPTGGSDTLSNIGPIAWSLPSGSGSSYTLTASGVVSGVAVSGTKTVSTVSANPTILVTSPKAVSGVVYSMTSGVVFNGNANSSLGYPPTTTIASVTFSVDKGAATAATIVSGTGTSMVTWSAGVFFSAGIHNITFTATDSSSNKITSALLKVLVDTTTPIVKFTTKTGANLTFGSSVTAVIVETLGDLNATSVSATRNGTKIAAANVVVTGTNNLGKNTTYTVSINNLPSGTWVLALSAKDLAGNMGSATSITVHVTVPFAQSVIINSASYGTLGNFAGVTVSATNIWSTSQNLVVFAVWKNEAGQTVAVTTGGLTLASGATGTAFAPLAGQLPSGTYTVNVFVITTGNNPVSSTTSIIIGVV